MREIQKTLQLAVVFAALAISAIAGGPFVVFPQAGELLSPDRQFTVRNVDAADPGSEFVGTFHSLWLTELKSNQSRKLCDYVGVAAVAWSRSDQILVTQYLSKKTSRVLMFPVDVSHDPLLLDLPSITQMVPPEVRDTLRLNDHVFIEASRVNDAILYLTIWGYGQHDPKGFRWTCEYNLGKGTLACKSSNHPEVGVGER